MSNPDWHADLRQRLSRLRLPPIREAEIVDELAGHLEDRYREHLAAGKSETEAFALARAEVDESERLVLRLARVESAMAAEGGVVGEPTRRAWFASGWQDVRYGWRALRKSPASTAAAVAMLALGTGVNTAVFSVVDAVFFQSPFHDPARIVMVQQPNAQRGTRALNGPLVDGGRLQRLTTVFDSVSALRLTNPILTTGEQPRRLQGECVQASMFRVLGIAPTVGRPFTAEEDRPGGDPVAVISDTLARQTFGSAAQALGRTLTLDGHAVGVVGVMAPEFAGVRAYHALDLWAPLGQGADGPSAAGCDARFGGNFYGRIRSDLTVSTADARLAAITAGSRRLVSLEDSTVGDDRATLELLVAAVGFVLLIACGNVANLMLDRAVHRRREIATRLALGASPGRLVRQVLTESVVLALLGTVSGVICAGLALHSLVAILPVGVPSSATVALDARVLGVTLMLGIGAGLLSGLVPGLQSSSRVLTVWLLDARAVTLPSRSWTKRLLVVTEVALSVALLVGAALMIRSFMTLRPTRPGFDPANKWVASLRLSGARYKNAAARVTFLNDFADHLRRQPGISGVSAVNFAPFSGMVSYVPITVAGRSDLADGHVSVFLSDVTANYFEEMRMSIKAGRGFLPSDKAGSPPVAIVSEAVARRLWPDGDAIGSVVALKNPGADSTPRQIVGIASDLRIGSNTTQPSAQVYFPLAQDPSPFLTVIVRAAAIDSGALAPAIRRAAVATDATQVLDSVQSFASLLARSVAGRRSLAVLMGAFAAMSIGLAVVGLVTVIGSTVAQRAQEIGIRMALGARPRAVVGLVLREAVALSCAGVVIGLGVAAVMTRLLTAYLYGVTPLDLATFVGSAVTMLAVAIMASYIPARHATQVDPVIAFRTA